MCFMNKYLDLNLADLRHVSLECACGSRFTMDLSKQNMRTPTSCYGCGR